MVNSRGSDANREWDFEPQTPVVDKGHYSLAKKIEYKFDEEKICKEILDFIDKTYSGHYSGERGQKIQVTEFSLSHCDNPQDALRFNVLKYAARYGKKKGWNKEDLLKSAHYLVMMINFHNMYLEGK